MVRATQQERDVSNSDSFIDEVSDEVRRDRLYKVYKKYAWVFVLLVFGIVGGAAWNEYSKAQNRTASEAAGADLQAALDASDAALLDGLAAGNADAAVIAQLQQAAMQIDAGDRDAALVTLTALSVQPDLAPAYRDLAMLKLVVIDGANMDSAALMSALNGLSLPGAPYRMLAIEQRALHFVRQGDVEAALRELKTITDAAETTQGLLRRAQELTIALGGSLDGPTTNG